MRTALSALSVAVHSIRTNLGTILGKVGRWALIVIIALAAIVGVQHVSRGTAVRHVQGVGADGTPVAPGEPQFSLSVAMLTGTVLLPANHVEIALNGDGTYARLWEDLRSARRSITLQLYFAQGGQIADTLRQILMQRAAAGVRVFMLYDAFGFQRMPADHRPRFATPVSSWCRFVLYGCPLCTWRRTALTCAASSWMGVSDGPAVSPSTTGGSGMGA